jgi:hypothetical protein
MDYQSITTYLILVEKSTFLLFDDDDKALIDFPIRIMN